MEAKLIVVGGKANKAEVPLKLPATIGRGREAHLTIAHPTVSRRHCLVYELDGVLMVQDKGSLNGTYIDGERVEADRILRPGQTLTIGPLTFRAEYEVADSSQDVLADGPAAGRSVDAMPVAPADAAPEPQPAKPLLPPTDAPETLHFASGGLNETTDLPPVASPASAAKPADDESGEFALPIDAEPDDEPGRFDFLDDEPIAGEAESAESPALSGSDIGKGDSGEIFSFADEPPAIDQPKADESPPDKKKSKSPKTKDVSKSSVNGESERPAEKLPQIRVGGAEPAPAVHQSDDELNNFFESIGLE